MNIQNNLIEIAEIRLNSCFDCALKKYNACNKIMAKSCLKKGIIYKRIKNKKNDTSTDI